MLVGEPDEHGIAQRRGRDVGLGEVRAELGVEQNVRDLPGAVLVDTRLVRGTQELGAQENMARIVQDSSAVPMRGESLGSENRQLVTGRVELIELGEHPGSERQLSHVRQLAVQHDAHPVREHTSIVDEVAANRETARLGDDEVDHGAASAVAPRASVRQPVMAREP